MFPRGTRTPNVTNSLFLRYSGKHNPRVYIPFGFYWPSPSVCVPTFYSFLYTRWIKQHKKKKKNTPSTMIHWKSGRLFVGKTITLIETLNAARERIEAHTKTKKPPDETIARSTSPPDFRPRWTRILDDGRRSKKKKISVFVFKSKNFVLSYTICMDVVRTSVEGSEKKNSHLRVDNQHTRWKK